MNPAPRSLRPIPRAAWALAALLAVALTTVLVLRGEPTPIDRAAKRTSQPIETRGDDAAAALVAPQVDVERSAAAPTSEAAAAAVEPGTVEPPPAPEDERLIVRVVDAARQPVEGVSIEWVVVHPTHGSNEQIIKGETDAGGHIVPENAARMFIARFGDGGGGTVAWMISALGLRCTLPFQDYEPRDGPDPPGVLWLDAEPADGAVIDLVLPPSGAVRFEWEPLVTDGTQVLEGYFLHIRRADGDHFPRWRTGFSVPRGAAHHRFAPVGPGWDVYGSLSHPDVLGTLGSVTAPGPTRADETVILRIERAEGQSVLARLRGVAADATGAPLAAARVRVSLGDPDVRSTLGKRVLTDEDGAWSFLVARDALTALAGAEARPGEVTLTARIDGEECRGIATFTPRDAERDELDLGSVELNAPLDDTPPPTLLAGGRVVDTAGKPVHGAYVTVSVRARSRGGEPVEDPDEWLDLVWKKTDREGRYELSDVVELADSTVRVRVSHSDHLAVERKEVAVGRSDVDFLLTRGLAVTLTVDVEPWAAAAEAVSLRFSGDGVSRKPSLMDFAAHYGGRFAGLEAGRYTLQVRMRGGDWVLHEQELDVLEDVDLGVIDVSGRLLTCHLELQDASGAPYGERYVRVVDPATRRTIDRSARVGDGGVVHMIVPSGLASVRLEANDGTSAYVPSSAFTVPTRGIVPERVTITLGR